MPDVKETLAASVQPPRPEQLANAYLYDESLYASGHSRQKALGQASLAKIYPQSFSVARSGLEPCLMQTQCLARLGAGTPLLSVVVRFTQPMSREVAALKNTVRNEQVDGESLFRVVPELEVAGQFFQTGQETVEREIRPLPVTCDGTAQRTVPFEFPESENAELLCDKGGRVVGRLSRRQEDIQGTVEIMVETVEKDICKITVRILNESPLPPESIHDHGAVLMCTLLSAHLVLHLEGGEFIPLDHPPEELRLIAAECENIGGTAVLIESNEEKLCNALLSAPAIAFKDSSFPVSKDFSEIILEGVLPCAGDETR